MSPTKTPPAEVGSTVGPAAEARKKRRFFAAKLPTLPLVSAVSTSIPTVVPSDRVLAALLPPRSVEPPPRIERPRREVRDRLDAVSNQDVAVQSKAPIPGGRPGSGITSAFSSPSNVSVPPVTKTIKIKPIQADVAENSEGANNPDHPQITGRGGTNAVNPVSSGAIVETSKTLETPTITPQSSSNPDTSKPTSRWWKTAAADTPAPVASKDPSVGAKSTTIKLSRGVGLKGTAVNTPTAHTTQVVEGQKQSAASGQKATPSLSDDRSTKIKLKRQSVLEKGSTTETPTAEVNPGPESPIRELEQPESIADRTDAFKQVPIKLKQPPPYDKIKKNIFPERALRKTGGADTCSCDRARGSGTECQDRANYVLCGPKCSCAGKCANTRLAKRKTPLTAVVYTGSRGFCLLAMKDIKKGEFVIDYRGEVITIRTFRERCRNEYANNTDFYATVYDKTEIIDAGICGNQARFINHSCAPNLETRRYSLRNTGLDEFEVGFWALRDIDAGEELSYDHNLVVVHSNLITDERATCRCGEAECVGYFGRVSGLRGILSNDEEAGLKAGPTRKKRKHKSLPGPATAMTESITVAGDRDVAQQTTASTSERQAIPTRVKKKIILRASLPSQKTKSLEKADDITAADANALVAEMNPDERLAAENSPKRRKRRAINDNPLLPRVKRQKRDFPGLTVPFTCVPLSPFRQDPALHLEEVEESVPRFSTPPSQRDPDGRSSSPPQRISGWADWLVRKAGEKPRTLEQWQDFAIQRRRGKEWKEKMMELFGVAPYEGGPRLPWEPEQESLSPGCPAAERSPSPQHLQLSNTRESAAGPSSRIGDMPDGLKGDRSVDYVDEEIDELDPSEPPSDHEEEDRKPTIPSITATPKNTSRTTSHGKGKAAQRSSFSTSHTDHQIAAQTGRSHPSLHTDARAVINNETDRPIAIASPLWPIFAQTRPSPAGAMDPPSINPVQPSTSAEASAAARIPSPVRQPTEKKQAIAKRNGAPMGWAYVPVTTEPAAPVPTDVGPRSARKARATSFKDDDRRKSLSTRR